jgi:hypothetical protein
MLNEIFIDKAANIAAFVKANTPARPDGFVCAITKSGTLYRKAVNSWDTAMGLGDLEK